ncbi:MAG TPA: DUF4012 domain-containing protein, partial [Ktedonobacteraceae bacterium]|nr:DUF4012 domain-containing protein [Ktedonobacteraceae bacterium]
MADSFDARRPPNFLVGKGRVTPRKELTTNSLNGDAANDNAPVYQDGSGDGTNVESMQNPLTPAGPDGAGMPRDGARGSQFLRPLSGPPSSVPPLPSSTERKSGSLLSGPASNAGSVPSAPPSQNGAPVPPMSNGGPMTPGPAWNNGPQSQPWNGGSLPPVPPMSNGGQRPSGSLGNNGQMPSGPPSWAGSPQPSNPLMSNGLQTPSTPSASNGGQRLSGSLGNNGQMPSGPPSWNGGPTLAGPPSWNGGPLPPVPPLSNGGPMPAGSLGNNGQMPSGPPSWNGGPLPPVPPMRNQGPMPPPGPGQGRGPAASRKMGLLKRARAKYNTLSRRSQLVVIILLCCMLLPFVTTLVEGVNAYILYSHARSGIQHLTNIQSIYSGLHANNTGYLNADRLHRTQQELDSAHEDFMQIRDSLDEDVVISGVGLLAPSQVSTLRSLAHIGVDATEMGQHFMGAIIKAAPGIHEPILAASSEPILTTQAFDLLHTALKQSLPLLKDMDEQSRGISVDVLPLSDHQRKQLTEILPVIPVISGVLEQADSMWPALGWILGVGTPRTFLIQTMDRAELRPTGGFTGQFAPLDINGGRVGQISLQDIGPFEKGSTMLPVVAGQRPPDVYNWWPIDNWGIRDSNLSADFPTSAKLTADLYKEEFNKPVDGVISFSLFLITHVLQITGPITVPLYKETITPQNLEEKLHFYQDQYGDNGGIRIEKEIEHVNDDQLARKLFTKRLTNLLMDHIRSAPPSELVALANEMLYALKTKDIEVYFTDPQVEALVGKYGSTGQIDTSTNHDGLMVVETNVSASKNSKYVRTNIQDNVTLDAAGGATHVVNIRFAYTWIDFPYGFDTYRDYVRVYVPPSAQFLGGNGFDLGQSNALCYSNCPDDVYGDGSLLCPTGMTNAGFG